MMGIRKILSILLCFVLMLQAGGALVFASGMPGVYWGQNFTAEEDYGALPCTAMFYHEPNVTNYEFKLFKDGLEVYSNRIEEGLFGGNEGFWEEECLFLDKFCLYDSGSYHFSVSSLEGNGLNINEAAIIETKVSETFSYTQPQTALSVPKIAMDSPNLATWESTDENTYGYFYDLEVHYSNGTIYDPDYTETYTTDTYFDPKYIESALDYLQDYNPEKYPKANATIKVRVRAMPEDVRQFQPSAYSNWTSIKLVSSDSGEEEPVDRSKVDSALYDFAKVAYDLGIMPEVYDKAKSNVTIGGIAPILVALMGLEKSAESLTDTVIFTDTVKGEYLTGCINALYYQRVLNGQGDGTVGVNVELLYPQIVKMLVDICGYSSRAQSYGGYPSGYIATAGSCGILKNLVFVANNLESITHEQLSQLIYNTLQVKLMVVDGYSAYGGTIYKITDDTLLYQLGYVRYEGDVTFKEDNLASITGTLYELDNPKGIAVTDKSLVIEDQEMLDYQIPKMILYVKSGGIVSALEVYQASAVVNNGEYIATSWMVPISLSAIGYTKYKINDGEYKPIPKGETYHWLGSKKSQYYNIKITFANEDETRSKTINDGAKLEIKRNITWMVNGEVYKTTAALVEEKIILPESPYLANYNFDGWIAVPEIMPDKDIVLHARMTPTATVTGTLTYKGEPVENAYITLNGYYQSYYTNAEGQYTVTLPVGESVISVYSSSHNISETFMVTVDETTTDIGTYALSSVTEKVGASTLGVLKAEGLKELLTEEDYTYAETDEGNRVRVQMNVYSSSENANISAYMQENYPEYTMANLQNITLQKVKSGTESSTEAITQTESLITLKIAIPTAQQGKETYQVLREHDGVVDAITKEPNDDGEYIAEITDDSITVKTKKFSAYGVIGAGIAPLASTYILNTDCTALNSITVDVVVPETPKADAVLYVAFYNAEGRLIDLKTRTVMAPSETFTISEDAFQIKAFIWDSNLKSLYQ